MEFYNDYLKLFNVFCIMFWIKRIWIDVNGVFGRLFLIVLVIFFDSELVILVLIEDVIFGFKIKNEENINS